MKNIYVIDFDMKMKSVFNINFKQGDIDSSVIEVHLFDNKNVIDITGESIEFRFLKPDNTVVFQDITSGVNIIDAVNGKVECILKSNTLSAIGVVKCEIHRSLSGKTLTTPSFNFTVESSIGENGVLSSNYISSIENKLVEWQSIFSANEIIRTNTFNTAETARAVNETIRMTEFKAIKSEYDLSTHENTNIEIVNARKGEINLGTKIEKITSSLDKKADKINAGRVNFVEKYGYLVINNDWTIAFQTAIDNESSLYIPSGEYNISNTILINSGRVKDGKDFGLYVQGDTQTTTILNFTNTTPNNYMFRIKGVMAWGDRYKRFENIKFKAIAAKSQHIFRLMCIEGEAEWDSGFQIQKCQVECTGYFVNHLDGYWCGNSFIKDCEIHAGGIIKAIPKRKTPYPHSFSSLVLEDLRFSGKSNRRGAAIHLVGAQGTTMKNIVLEGIEKHFDTEDSKTGIIDGYPGLAAYTGAYYIHLESTSAKIINLWTETGGANNLTDNVKAIIITSSSQYSYYGYSVEIDHSAFLCNNENWLIGRTDGTGAPLIVTIKGIPLYQNNFSNIIVNKGAILYFEKCIYKNNVIDENRYNVIFKDCVSASVSGDDYTYGNAFPSIQIPNKKIYYNYTGGYVHNKYGNMKISFWDAHYPHKNPTCGNTLIVQKASGAYRLGTLSITHFPDMKNLKGNLYSFVCYRGLHNMNPNSGSQYEGVWQNHWGVTNNTGSFYDLENYLPIGNGHNLHLLTGFEPKYLEYKHIIYSSYLCNPEATNGLLDTIDGINTITNDLHMPNLEGTWVQGDIVRNPRPIPTITNRKYITKICTETGTSRAINVDNAIACTVDRINPKKIIIPSLASFQTIIPGDYLKINNTATKYRVLDYKYDVTGNYILLEQNCTEASITSITNYPCAFIIGNTL